MLLWHKYSIDKALEDLPNFCPLKGTCMMSCVEATSIDFFPLLPNLLPISPYPPSLPFSLSPLPPPFPLSPLLPSFPPLNQTNGIWRIQSHLSKHFTTMERTSSASEQWYSSILVTYCLSSTTPSPCCSCFALGAGPFTLTL